MTGEGMQALRHRRVNSELCAGRQQDRPLFGCLAQTLLYLILRHHSKWQPGQAEIAAEGGAGRRSAKNAAAPINQSREAHRSARPLHSPEGGHELHDG
jgi:hypothetical protein